MSMIDDLARRWRLPVGAHGRGLVVKLDGTGLCVFVLPAIVGRAVHAALRFDDTDPPVWRGCPHRHTRGGRCHDLHWALLAAADWRLTARDTTELKAASVIHVDTGVIGLPMPGAGDWVTEPGSPKPLPSRSSVATFVRVMSLPKTG